MYDVHKPIWPTMSLKILINNYNIRSTINYNNIQVVLFGLQHWPHT